MKLREIMSRKDTSDNVEKNNQLSKIVQYNKHTNTGINNSNMVLTIPNNYNNPTQEISQITTATSYDENLNNKLSSEIIINDFVHEKTLGNK